MIFTDSELKVYAEHGSAVDVRSLAADALEARAASATRDAALVRAGMERAREACRVVQAELLAHMFDDEADGAGDCVDAIRDLAGDAVSVRAAVESVKGA